MSYYFKHFATFTRGCMDQCSDTYCLLHGQMWICRTNGYSPKESIHTRLWKLCTSTISCLSLHHSAHEGASDNHKKTDKIKGSRKFGSTSFLLRATAIHTSPLYDLLHGTQHRDTALWRTNWAFTTHKSCHSSQRAVCLSASRGSSHCSEPEAKGNWTAQTWSMW